MRAVLAILTTISLLSCSEKPSGSPERSSDGKTVLTTFYPTQYFAERIAGDHLNIGCPVPADADPVFWKPDKAAIQKYQAADLIIINGADFEKWIKMASLPENRIVDTTKSFEQDFIQYKESVAHKHGPEGEHTHEGTDGHTWLDPNNAKIQAAAIHRALAKRWPQHATDFEKNFQLLVADLDALDDAFGQIDAGSPLLASHATYNYVARRYGWEITSLELDPDLLPPKDAIPAGHAAQVLLWESPPREQSVALLEKRHGVRSVVFSPAESQGELDYLATMKANLERLSRALARD